MDNSRYKFRVWHKKEKKMYPLDAISWLNGKYEISSDKFNIRWENLEPNFELMQYTELKDINGKEIWEGDIVKIHSPQDKIFNYIGVVMWENYQWGIGIKHIDWMLSNYTNYPFEIIGNLYENSGILEGK